MEVVIFADVDECTNRYHSDGGIVVIAHNAKDAQRLANAHIKRNSPSAKIEGVTDSDVNTAIRFPLAKGAIGYGSVFIFPDAGCC